MQSALLRHALTRLNEARGLTAEDATEPDAAHVCAEASVGPRARRALGERARGNARGERGGVVRPRADEVAALARAAVLRAEVAAPARGAGNSAGVPIASQVAAPPPAVQWTVSARPAPRVAEQVSGMPETIDVNVSVLPATAPVVGPVAMIICALHPVCAMHAAGKGLNPATLHVPTRV